MCNIPSGSEKWDWCPGPIADGGCDGLVVDRNLSSGISGDQGQVAVSVLSSSLALVFWLSTHRVQLLEVRQSVKPV